MIKLNQQTLREPILGEIVYMKTQKAMMENSTSQGEKANFLNNRGYVFQPINHLPTHYHLELRNHDNLSYGNQEIVPRVSHQLSVSNVAPNFQGQGASTSNYQGLRRQTSFEESGFHILNYMKKNNDN